MERLFNEYMFSFTEIIYWIYWNYSEIKFLVS
jgi:hypothetical protein